MDVAMATSAGHPGRPNEDFVGAVPGAVVLLDGAGIPGSASLCRHGTAWYTHRLGGSLLGWLSRDDGRALSGILADAIDHVAREHRDTCDLGHPNSPQATVALFRAGGDRADYLMLADSHLLLGAPGDAPVVITDERETTVRQSCLQRLDGLLPGTKAYEAERASVGAEMRTRRNHPGGYWIAKDDPLAAGHAVTGVVPVAADTHVALLSNGVTRLVDAYRVETWASLLERCRTDGAVEVLRVLREHEAGGSAVDGSVLPTDDATVASCSLSRRSRRGRS